MHSVKILLVEDDNFKADLIVQCLEKQYERAFKYDACETIRNALIALEDNEYDLVLLDMALAGRNTIAGGGSPNQFPDGGVEILRSMAFDNMKIPVVVITQFPEVLIEGKPTTLGDLPRAIEDDSGFRLTGVVHFEQNSDNWKSKLISLMGSL